MPGGVAIDGSGIIYITGDPCLGDLDPGPGKWEGASAGFTSPWAVFLSKLGQEGDLIWGRAWGGDSIVTSADLLVDDSGGIYVTGVFRYTVDFDPGPRVVERTDPYATGPTRYVGSTQIYLSRLTSDGEFDWVQTWLGLPPPEWYGASGFARLEPDLALDRHGNVYCVCVGTVRKFSPSGEIEALDDMVGDLVATEVSEGFYVAGDYWEGEERRYTDLSPVFLKRYDSNGELMWERNWGGSTRVDNYRIVTDVADNAYVLGKFDGPIDLDPGEAEDVREGTGDLFLSKFNPGGALEWARTWDFGPTHVGIERRDESYDIAVDESENVYVVGLSYNRVDLDPGPEEDLRGSDGSMPVSGYPQQVPEATFLVKLDSMGDYQWGRTWDGMSSSCHAIAIDHDGNVYIAGAFDGFVDLDPGPSKVMRSSDSGSVFIIKLRPDGALWRD